MKRLFVLATAVLLALCAAGCAGNEATTQQPSATAETESYVTAFGTVRCAESLTLALPVEIRLLEVHAREGETLPAGTAVFRVDMARLQSDKALLDTQLECRNAAWEGANAQVKQAEADLARAQAAEKAMNVDELLGILKSLANAGSRSKRGSCEAKLLAYLNNIDSVSQYQNLVGLTADRRNVANNARPALLQLKAQLNQNCKELKSGLISLRQASQQAQADALSWKQKADIMNGVCSGQVLCGIGGFRQDGVFVTAGRPLLLVAAPQYGNQIFAAGATAAVFEAPDTREIEANIEEQLISGITAGAQVQISAQYNKGSVWIGALKSISDQAVVVNGETVVPVTITAEKMELGPGYNVIVKIYPASKNTE